VQDDRAIAFTESSLYKSVFVGPIERLSQSFYSLIAY